MRYGAIPDNVLERAALAGGVPPRALLDALFPLLQTRALMAAVSLGLFEALREEPLAAGEVAARRGLDPAATEDTLRVLAHAGYLVWSDSRFALTASTRRDLLERGDGRPSLASYLRWNYTQWEFLAGIEPLLETGHGVDFHATMADPEHWRLYQESMLALARVVAPILAGRVPVRRGARRLLDVAGGHGLLGAALCRRHPPLRSTVLDLPAAIPAARRLAEAEGIGDLVEHRAGDLSRDDWGEGWDVILLSNILHHFPPDETERILERAWRCSSPQGTVAIWEFERPGSARRPSAGDAAALYFRLTSGAGCYSGGQFAGWLEGAGFDRVRVIRPLRAPGSVLVHARRGLRQPR